MSLFTKQSVGRVGGWMDGGVILFTTNSMWTMCSFMIFAVQASRICAVIIWVLGCLRQYVAGCLGEGGMS